MKKLLMISAVIASVGLTACATDRNGNSTIGKQDIGAVTGAVLGGLAGSQMGKGSGQLWATGAGAVLGGLMGSEIGASLDRADQMAMQRAQTTAYAAPIGETIKWNNPESGNTGTITPMKDGTSSSGRYCREYQTTVTVGGKQQQGYGTACQQPDGSWEVVK